jgi:hypothetical protein
VVGPNMKMTEDQKAAVGHYKALVESMAWKDLEQLASEKVSKSREGLDAILIEDFTMPTICEERGFRKGIKWVLDQAKIKAEIG